MILVDTSVWIDYFNGKQDLHTDTLDSELIEGNVAIGDLILLEILQGFLLPGELAAALDDDLTGIVLADLKDELGQGIDPRAVQKSEFAKVQDQRRRFSISSLGQ